MSTKVTIPISFLEDFEIPDSIRFPSDPDKSKVMLTNNKVQVGGYEIEVHVRKLN